MILLNPGPVTLSKGVREAMLGPDLCHREPEFFDLQDEIRRALLSVYGLSPERWTAVLLSGSGTAAMEAMVSSLVPLHGRLLVVENGVYGERFSHIAVRHDIPHTSLRCEWGAGIALGQLAQALDAEPRLTHVAVVHHETTTGRLNDLKEIGVLCASHNLGLLVDGVSSFGAENLDFEGWGITACAVAANKCLHAVPGLAAVLVDREALASESATGRSLYLDLSIYSEPQDRRGTPFTPAVPCYYALAEALRELFDEGGWRARHRQYARLAGQVRQGFERLGIHPLLPEGCSSVALRAYQLPDKLPYARLHDGLKDRGFVIYAGQGGLAQRMFRISTMGAITVEDIDRFLGAVQEVLDSCRP